MFCRECRRSQLLRDNQERKRNANDSSPNDMAGGGRYRLGIMTHAFGGSQEVPYTGHQSRCDPLTITATSETAPDTFPIGVEAAAIAVHAID